MASAFARNRLQPIPIPPLNRITMSATVTTRCTPVIEFGDSVGKRSLASAAATRKITGAGRFSRSLTRFESTASSSTAQTPPTAARRPGRRPLGEGIGQLPANLDATNDLDTTNPRAKVRI